MKVRKFFEEGEFVPPPGGGVTLAAMPAPDFPRADVVELHRRLLYLCLAGEIRDEEGSSFRIIARLEGKPARSLVARAMWEFLRNNWDDLEAGMDRLTPAGPRGCFLPDEPVRERFSGDYFRISYRRAAPDEIVEW